MASQLVIAVPAPDPTAASNWRLQLERARSSLAGLQAAAPAAREEVEGAAERLAADAAALEASEAAAGAELGGLREQHRAALAAVATLQQEWDSRREYVGQLEAELVFLNKVWTTGLATPALASCTADLSPAPAPSPLLSPSQELEERQREVAEQGDSMSDTRPVARLAEACAALRAEIAQMKVRRGVLQAALLGAAART